jgi:ankyrin repeat protein
VTTAVWWWDTLDIFSLDWATNKLTANNVSEKKPSNSEACQSLFKAVELNDALTLRELLDGGGVHPDITDKNGNTPLHVAAQMGHKAMVQVGVEAKDQGTLTLFQQPAGTSRADSSVSTRCKVPRGAQEGHPHLTAGSRLLGGPTRMVSLGFRMGGY